MSSHCEERRVFATRRPAPVRPNRKGLEPRVELSPQIRIRRSVPGKRLTAAIRRVNMDSTVSMSLTGSRNTGDGFTLIELLVVLAVMGLALALVVPSLSRVLPGLELRTDARNVANALRETRSLAVGRNYEMTLIIDVEKRTLRLAHGAAIQLNPRLDMSLLTASSETAGTGTGGISFFPDGSSTGGRVTLALDERRRHVVVDWLTGAVSIVE